MLGQKIRVEKNHLSKRSQCPKSGNDPYNNNNTSVNPKRVSSSPGKSEECNTPSIPKLQATPKSQRTKPMNSSSSGSSNISAGSSLGGELSVDSCNIQLAQLDTWDQTLRLPGRPQGIERGLVLEKILKSFKMRGETFLIVKWKGLSVLDAVLLNGLTELYPHIVIEYFEKLEMRCEPINM